MFKKILFPLVALFMLAGCAKPPTTIEVSPTITLPQQDPSLMGVTVSINGADQRTDQALAKVTRDNQIVTLTASRDLRFLLQEVLDEYQGTALIVSHDRDFLDRLVTSVIYMPGDGSATEYPGWYSDLEQKLQNTAAKSPTKPAPKAPAKKAPQAAPQASKPAKLSYKQQRLLEVLPQQMENLEKEIAAIEEALSDANLYNANREEFDRLTAELEDKRAKLDEAENQWLEVELLQEELAAGK